MSMRLVSWFPSGQSLERRFDRSVRNLAYSPFAPRRSPLQIAMSTLRRKAHLPFVAAAALRVLRAFCSNAFS